MLNWRKAENEDDAFGRASKKRLACARITAATIYTVNDLHKTQCSLIRKTCRQLYPTAKTAALFCSASSRPRPPSHITRRRVKVRDPSIDGSADSHDSPFDFSTK